MLEAELAVEIRGKNESLDSGRLMQISHFAKCFKHITQFLAISKSLYCYGKAANGCHGTTGSSINILGS